MSCTVVIFFLPAGDGFHPHLPGAEPAHPEIVVVPVKVNDSGLTKPVNLVQCLAGQMGEAALPVGSSAGHGEGADEITFS